MCAQPYDAKLCFKFYPGLTLHYKRNSRCRKQQLISAGAEYRLHSRISNDLIILAVLPFRKIRHFLTSYCTFPLQTFVLNNQSYELLVEVISIWQKQFQSICDTENWKMGLLSRVKLDVHHNFFLWVDLTIISCVQTFFYPTSLWRSWPSDLQYNIQP